MTQKNKFILWRNFLIRSLREGIVGFWRNRFLSITTILLGALILFLLNFIFSIKFFADYSLKNLESRADFTVPLREDADTFRLDGLKNDLKNKYNLELDIKEGKDFDDFSIPRRLHIKFLDITEVKEVLTTLQELKFDEVIGDWDAKGEVDFVNLIEKLLRIRVGVEKASIWLLLFFISGGILLAINTFRMMIFSRKDEVFIARLVGANSMFIAGPFLFEGFFLGVISSIIAIFSFIFVLQKITIIPSGEIFIYLWNYVFSYEILVAGLIGVVGAWIAVKKYLFSPLSTKDE